MSNPSPFGGFGNTAKPSVFGATTTGTTGNIFGGGAGSNTNTTGGGIFGGGAPANPGTTTTTPSLFGQNSSTAASSQPGAPKPPAFGGFGGGGSVFGSAAPSGTGASTSAPGTGLFGSAAPAFGTNPTTGGTAGTTTPGSLFGSAAPAASTTAPSSNLFGGGTSAGGSLFGNKPASSSAPVTPGVGSNPPAFGSGLFGTKPAESGATGNTASATSAAPTSLFGGFTKPGSSTPAPGGLFGAPASTGPGQTTTGTSTPAIPSLFNSGAPKDSAAPNTSAPAATTSSTAPPAFSLFGAKKDETKEGDKGAAPTTTPSLFGNMAKPAGSASGTSTPAPSLGLFGAPAASKPTDTNKPGSAPPSVNLFGSVMGPSGTSTPAGTATKPAEGAPSGASGTGDKPAASTTGAPASTAVTSAPLIPPSVLKGKTIEDIVNQWSTDLESSAREFGRFANEVSAWDRTLIENGNQIANLYASVLAAEKSQNDIDQSLNHIEEQQKQLSEALDGYEKVSNDFFEGQGIRGLDIGPADTEREKSYNLAATLNNQLDDLARSLSSMIEEVNAVTASSGTSGSKAVDNLSLTGPSGGQDATVADDPMSQIQAILNSHLDSLSWINDSVRDMDQKVKELEVRFGGTRADDGFGVGLHQTRPSGGARSRYGL